MSTDKKLKNETMNRITRVGDELHIFLKLNA